MPAYTGSKRQISTVVAAFCTFIFALLLVLSLYVFRWSLIWVLAFWFAFLLSLFHLVFFWRKSTTAWEVKLIDYPYLLIGAFSILLAVAGGNKERDNYIRELDEIAAPSTVEGLQSLITSSRNQFCDDTANYKPESYCQWTFQISEFLSNNYTTAQLRDEIQNRSKLIAVSMVRDQRKVLLYYVVNPAELIHLWHNLNPFGLVNLVSDWHKQPITAQPVVNLTYALIIRSMQKYEKQVSEISQGPGIPEVPVTSLGSIALGLGKVLVWPFVLAIAVALRITKVTADVTGWAG